MEKFCCEMCPYHYKTEDDRFPCCHYEGTWEAPCEQDEEYDTPDCDEEEK